MLVRKACAVQHKICRRQDCVKGRTEVMLGLNESYVALCRKHYKEGKLWKEDE